VEDAELRAAVRAEVRRYVATAAARYVPIVAGALALVLLVVLVPDSRQPTGSSTLSNTNGLPSAQVPGVVGPSATTPVVGGGGGATPGAVPPGSGGTGGGSTGPGSAFVPPAGGSTSGVAVSGVRCGAGARQFTWSPYAPSCLARWSGNNGGSTAHGVTAKTITLVMRNPSDWDSLAKSTGAPTFAALAHDEQVLINYFNTQYELYGRKVILKTFNGNGSFLSETANQGQASANSDAQQAYQLGAFADGFPIVTGTYADAESSRHIVQFAPANSAAAYKANAPYRYGFPAGAVNETQGAGIGSLVCQRMAGMKAIFAGDPTYQAMNRKFAVVEAEQAQFAGGAAVIVKMAKQCGVNVETFQYSSDLSSEAQQAAQIDTRMKADGVTTVLSLTDPLMVGFMTDAASQQQYKPEWVFTVLPPAQARQADASEMAHSIDVSPWHALTGSPSTRMCARIYKRADPSGQPQSGAAGIDDVCSLLLAFYAGLQQAGPSLSPQTFQRGWFTLPRSAGSSDFGAWSFGAGQWSPAATFSVLQWNASATSQYDGGTGEYEACGGPVDYPYLDAKLGSGQLRCYGH
jgi:hypothetical protein